MDSHHAEGGHVPPFGRAFLGSDETFTRIGDGSLGGKAHGLVSIRAALERAFPQGSFGPIRLAIPRLTVLGTDLFDAFMARNDLYPVALSEQPDDRIAHAFQQADLPPECLGDLRELARSVHFPLAVRSSSLLEDALARPFAGVYETKMVPNNQPDVGARFHALVEAVKLIYSSTFFRGARAYRRAAGEGDESEKMAVILQAVVGERRGLRYYPDLSFVAKSFNYYPSGRARPEEGVVSLALGLGKTIVDGGVCWSYSPAWPKAPPPFASASQLLKETQARFWAVNMGPPPTYDPIAETEYLVEGNLSEAEYDGTLRWVASTYHADSDRLYPGTGGDGPRALNFAPLLQLDDYPFNELMRRLLQVCEEALEAEVEVEGAVTFPRGEKEARLGFLQVRPMVAPETAVDIPPEELAASDVLVATERAMGNGIVDHIRDVVYLRPEAFNPKFSRVMAREIEGINLALTREDRPYLLIGFGRWGSSDPWLGIPVVWSQVSGAKVIVEATLPSMRVEPSQGSHFFHNLSSFGVSYLTVPSGERGGAIDWDRLDRVEPVAETEYVRHVRLPEPLLIRVDGRTGLGVVRWREWAW